MCVSSDQKTSVSDGKEEKKAIRTFTNTQLKGIFIFYFFYIYGNPGDFVDIHVFKFIYFFLLYKDALYKRKL